MRRRLGALATGKRAAARRLAADVEVSAAELDNAVGRVPPARWPPARSGR
ncbi:hypothetical protein G7085_17290 [Tessaracoccus sp. HDW20]|nr:hypothetical protein [Tessaracoccus coleopterorum]NHB85746.1 hypothetical protein [Tessaracoccus coleopterorum]